MGRLRERKGRDRRRISGLLCLESRDWECELPAVFCWHPSAISLSVEQSSSIIVSVTLVLNGCYKLSFLWMYSILQSRVSLVLHNLIRIINKWQQKLEKLFNENYFRYGNKNDFAGYCNCAGLLRFTFAAGISTRSTRLARVVREDGLDQCVGSLFELVNDSVVQGILVLLQPSGNVVRHLGNKATLSSRKV